MVQVLAFVSSLLSTSIGIGGGCILIPGLIYCSIEYKKAASTSLALIAVTTFIGTISHLFIVKESIPLLYLCYFIPCCLIGTMLAKPIIHLYKGRGAKIAFSFFIFFVAIKLLGISNTVSFIFFSLKDLLPAVPLFSIVPFALLVGFTATLLGVG
ncbi:MAG: TSUP family transporter [Bacteriovoracia bacterium]